MVIPARSRIVLLAPSQPSTRRPVNVCSDPSAAASAWTSTGWSPVSGPKTPSSPVTSTPRWKSISGCRSTRASSSCSRSGWWNMFACGKPCSADLVLAAELGHDAVIGVEQAQPAARPGPGQESLADADPPKRPGDFVIEVDGARQRMGLGVAFQQGDGYPEVGEQEGGGAADRAGADDDDAVSAAGVCLGGRVLVVHGGGPLSAVRAVARPVKAARGW